MEIGNTKLEILDLLADPDNSGIFQSRISKTLGIKQPSVSQHISELEDMGLISVDRSPENMNIKELTREGYRLREKAVGSEKPISGDELDISLHNLVVKFKISNPGDLDKGWIERSMSARPVRYAYDSTNDSYRVFTENYKFRITSRHIFVSLEDLRGSDPNHLKNRAMVEVFKARDWLENKSPVKITSRPADLEIWINRQHLAIISHPFAELVKHNSELELSDVSIYDSDGKERLWMDSSNGPELEAGNSPGENREYAEEDIDLLKEDLRWKIENKDKAEKLRKVPDEMEGLRDTIDCMRERIEELESSREDSESYSITITSKWMDRWGNIMGYSPDLEGPIKLEDKSNI